jgi:hypothetical protein
MDIGWREEGTKVFGIEFTREKCSVFLDPNQEFALRSKTKMYGTSVVGSLQVLLKYIHHFLNENGVSITAIGYEHHEIEKVSLASADERLARNKKRFMIAD